ncbi:fasciclin domain-containing protein [Cytophagales bacterium LB-30]|uniref:Fasciclin domain-containing protein n=1 Tax=Shiella aurantiaca TaxID=3058365 RepID=A0ABT8F4S6_9BACT|nr:fasciclin domain-containing protein [Shiella aurantiaca]MDN4165249.1 fasciclin domain-containing protein [Shiella aurantiaca]
MSKLFKTLSAQALVSRLMLLFVMSITLVLSACDKEEDEPTAEQPKTIAEIAQETSELSTLVAALEEANLLGTLQGEGSFTVFAPTNNAFNAFLEANGLTAEELLANPDLGDILLYHVLGVEVNAAGLVTGTRATLLEDASIAITRDGAAVILNGSIRVSQADIEASNGIIHIIDGVLDPSVDVEEPELPNLVDAATQAGLTTLLAAVEAADLGSTLLEAEALTVFAPTNDAFAALLEAYNVDDLTKLVTELGGLEQLSTVLGFHVVPAVAFSTDLADGAQTFNTLAGQEITVTKTNSGVTVTDAQGTVYSVSAADVAISNGVVHVIDGVLVPSLSYPTVVEAAEAAGLSVLLEAVTAADLGATLLDAEAITVFAPTNEAFTTLLEDFGAANLNELVEALGGLDKLSTVLSYHVVPTVAFSHDLTDGMTVETLAGQILTINLSGDNVTLTDVSGNTFSVTTANVVIGNGVVHVIDGVLIPELEEPAPNLVDAATAAGLTTLLDAVTAADLGSTLLEAEAITVFAPTNEAFGNLLTALNASTLDELVIRIGGLEKLVSVLGFHVVPAVAFSTDLAEGAQEFTTLNGQVLTVTKTGSAVTVTDAAGSVYNVSTADVEIANGVVHVIDGVVVPDLELPTVVEAAESAGLTTLLAAVTEANLGSTLLDAEAITVFAPSNAAFDELLARFEATNLDELVTAIGGVANLEKVLGFHVVPSVAFSFNLTDDMTVETLAGETLTINVSGDAVTVTDSEGTVHTVTTANVAIANGVVHVIDGVLVPSL